MSNPLFLVKKHPLASARGTRPERITASADGDLAQRARSRDQLSADLLLLPFLALLAACAGESRVNDVREETPEATTPAESSSDPTDANVGEEAGVCIAGAPLQDCDGDASNGCETDTFIDLNHCGACNSPCVSECIEGRCADPIDIALNFGRTCALLGTTEAVCWGLNYYGQLGNGEGGTLSDNFLPRGGTALEPPNIEEAVVSLEPTLVRTSMGAPLREIRQLALGLHHSCALVGQEGTVYCWGANYFGQLGDDTTLPRAHAHPVRARIGETGPLTGVTWLGSGRMQTCAVTSDARAVCWGRERFGSLGRRAGTDSTEVPVPIPSYVLSPYGTPISGVKAAALGATFSCFSSDTGLTCTGQAFEGRLGNGTGGPDVDSVVPVRGISGLGQWTQPVFALTNALVSQCALTTEGRVACWGNGGEGQLGQGDFTLRRSPAYVLNATGTDTLRGIRHISAASSHVCGTTDDDRAWCWGWNAYHSLGNTIDENELAIEGASASLPVAVLDPATGEPLSGIDRVVPGREHTCSLMRDKRVLCWGRNRFGELGHGSRSPMPALAAEARIHPR